jgi:Fur family transcriptional regulator, ferric uptake regulator
MALGPTATARFAESGNRMTAPRRAVLAAVSRAAGPFSIEEIYDAAPEVGRATAFRTMKLLQEVGVVCRVPLENGTVRYQLAESETHHHHLICSVCGSVAEFSDHSLDRGIERNATEAEFELDGHSVELYGRCSDCR